MTRSLVYKTRQPEKRERSFLLVSERKASLFLQAHNNSLKHFKISAYYLMLLSDSERASKILFYCSFLS